MWIERFLKDVRPFYWFDLEHEMILLLIIINHTKSFLPEAGLQLRILSCLQMAFSTEIFHTLSCECDRAYQMIEGLLHQ